MKLYSLKEMSNESAACHFLNLVKEVVELACRKFYTLLLIQNGLKIS